MNRQKGVMSNAVKENEKRFDKSPIDIKKEREKKKQQQEVGVDGGGFEWFGLRVFTEKP